MPSPKLLLTARDVAKPVTANRLGGVGPEQFSHLSYARASETLSFGATEPHALIPFVVEAWATPAAGLLLSVCINRTPIAGLIRASRYKRDIDFVGCGFLVERDRSKQTIDRLADKDSSFKSLVAFARADLPTRRHGLGRCRPDQAVVAAPGQEDQRRSEPFFRCFRSS